MRSAAFSIQKQRGGMNRAGSLYGSDGVSGTTGIDIPLQHRQRFLLVQASGIQRQSSPVLSHATLPSV